MEKVKRSELQIGDIVRLDGIEGYNDCTVCQIADGNVHVVRPYVHISDFICSSGVLTYIGQEKFNFPADGTTMTLLSRRHPETTRNTVRAIVNDVRQCIESGRTADALNALRNL